MQMGNVYYRVWGLAFGVLGFGAVPGADGKRVFLYQPCVRRIRGAEGLCDERMDQRWPPIGK